MSSRLRAPVPGHESKKLRHAAPAGEPGKHEPSAHKQRDQVECGLCDIAEQHAEQHKAAGSDLYLPHDLYGLGSIRDDGKPSPFSRLDTVVGNVSFAAGGGCELLGI